MSKSGEDISGIFTVIPDVGAELSETGKRNEANFGDGFADFISNLWFTAGSKEGFDLNNDITDSTNNIVGGFSSFDGVV